MHRKPVNDFVVEEYCVLLSLHIFLLLYFFFQLFCRGVNCPLAGSLADFYSARVTVLAFTVERGSLNFLKLLLQFSLLKRQLAILGGRKCIKPYLSFLPHETALWGQIDLRVGGALSLQQFWAYLLIHPFGNTLGLESQLASAQMASKRR